MRRPPTADRRLVPRARRLEHRLALCALSASCLLGALVVSACRGTENESNALAEEVASGLVDVQVLAFNDFHGNLEPLAGTSGMVFGRSDDPVVTEHPDAGIVVDVDAGVTRIPAGGAAYLASHIARLRRDHENTVVVSAGDLTGASPLLSSLFRDEPTVLAMNALGLDFEAVGNHDFDRGLNELLRLQAGGCSLGDCSTGRHFPGATFEYLAANVTSNATGMTIFPPYGIREFHGVKIAFVGMTLEGTPAMSAPTAVEGLRFDNEIATVNAVVPSLRERGVSAIVAVVHQGGLQAPSGTYDSCEGLSGDILPIVKRNADGRGPVLDPAVDVVITAHTHKAYNCMIDGRLVTSAGSAGRLLTQLELKIDPATRRLVSKQARNLPVTRDVAPDPTVASLVAEYQTLAAPLANRVVGYIASDLLRAPVASCESPLGRVIADSWLAATRDPAQGGAVLAIGGSPGGVRADILARGTSKPDRAVTYAEVFAAQPFGNRVATISLTGDALRELLERQKVGASPTFGNVSSGFSYAYTTEGADRIQVVPGSMMLDGVPVDPAGTYRVTLSDYDTDRPPLAPAKDRVIGEVDVDVLGTYLGSNGSQARPYAAPMDSRVSGNGCAR